VIWVAGAGSLLLLVFLIAGLVDLFRSRHTMEKWQVVVRTIALILVPIAGLIIYLFWLIERSETMAMQGIIRPGSPAVSDRRHRSGCRRSASPETVVPVCVQPAVAPGQPLFTIGRDL
jgi:hypothetical protein